MKKSRLFKILSKSDRAILLAYAEEMKQEHEVIVIKKPEKSLAMIKMREPVKESLFYVGEVMVTEAIVQVEGAKGIAVAMGDDFEKTLAMAVIDASLNAGLFPHTDQLYELEKEQNLKEEKENAMFLKTMVNFHSMDAK